MIVRVWDRKVIEHFLKQFPDEYHYDQLPLGADIYYLLSRSGLFPCVKHGDRMSCHAAIPIAKRGVEAVYSANQMFEWVWQNTDCAIIEARVKKNNAAARMYAASTRLERHRTDDQYVYYRLKR